MVNHTFLEFAKIGINGSLYVQSFTNYWVQQLRFSYVFKIIDVINVIHIILLNG